MCAGRLASFDVARLFSRAAPLMFGAGKGGRDGLAGSGRCSIASQKPCEPSRFAPALTTDLTGVYAASNRADLAAYGLQDGADRSPVKGRAPGSSEQLHRSGERKHGRSEPLMDSPQNSLRVIGAGEALTPRASDSLAKGGDDKGQSPLVLIFTAAEGRANRGEGNT